MFTSGFNFPSVDGLIEGVHYRVVEWNFADGQPVEKQEPEQAVQPVQQNVPAPKTNAAPAQPPQKTGPCGPDEKLTFGICRKTGQAPKDEKDFDSGSKTEQEKAVEAEAKKQGSDVKNNKPVIVDGRKYGWAVKNGKNVMVEWGAVAGEKKATPQQPPAVQGASGGPKPLGGGARPPAATPAATPAPKPQQPAAPASDPAAKIAELQQAMKVPGLPPAAQKALQAAIDLMGA